MKRIVLYHHKRGIFLGEELGLAFWSNIYSARQTEAITFKNVDDALDFTTLSWPIELLPDIQYIEVEATGPDNSASIKDILRAGLPGWAPEGLVYDA